MIINGSAVGGMGIHPINRDAARAGLRAVAQEQTLDRAVRIAAIYSFAHWLIEHPEVPVPESISGHWHYMPHDEADEFVRVAAVESVAKKLGEDMYGGRPEDGIAPQFTHYLANTREHGIDISYTGRAILDRKPE